MNISQSLLGNLRSIIADLGKNGGLMSPSIYDTAQALRYSPPADGVAPVLEWLLVQQQPDGGWGNPTAPKTRDVPTLASILALHSFRDEVKSESAVQAGLTFLKKQAGIWQEPLTEDLPVGVELILPRLLEDAAELNLDVPYEQYAPLVPLGLRKRQQIQHLNPGAGTPPAFSWEAWGTQPDPDLIDGSGGVGHNPTATAYWLHLANGRSDLAKEIQAARRYLERASKATGMNIPGVMPTAWPIDRYEQSFVLHTLLVAGLLDHPSLQDVVQPQLKDLAATMKPDGLGFSDFFSPDGDDTAAAIAALRAAGYPADYHSLERFAGDGYFIGYPGEFQSSHSLTARAVHAMVLFDEEISGPQAYIARQQQADGRWLGDKWHTSWLYSTLLAAFALKQSENRYSHALESTVFAVQSAQNPDGGWGDDGISTTPDTAYGALTLYVLKECNGINIDAIKRAHQWLLTHYSPFNYQQEQTWLNKQQYAPHRIDWGFELSAMIATGEMVPA